MPPLLLLTSMTTTVIEIRIELHQPELKQKLKHQMNKDKKDYSQLIEVFIYTKHCMKRLVKGKMRVSLFSDETPAHVSVHEKEKERNKLVPFNFEINFSCVTV